MSLYNVSTTPICLNSLIVNVNYFFLLEVNNFKHKKLKYIKKKKKKQEYSLPYNHTIYMESYFLIQKFVQ